MRKSGLGSGSGWSRSGTSGLGQGREEEEGGGGVQLVYVVKMDSRLEVVLNRQEAVFELLTLDELLAHLSGDGSDGSL